MFVLLSFNITGIAAAHPIQSQPVSADSLSPRNIYRDMLRSAYRDGTISENERYLLRSLQTSLHLPDSLVVPIEKSILQQKPHRLDQSGRWSVVVQNIFLGAGLYGWAIPFTLGADDPKWYIGTEMLSLGGTFYLTYQYTKDMNIPYSRAQMLRTGSLWGLRYGMLFNDVLKLWPPEVKLSQDQSKSWAVTLMASVPVGTWMGDYLYKKWKPSHGQSWALGLWSELGGFTATSLHQIVAGKKSKPARWEYESFENGTDQYRFDQRGYDSALKSYTDWKRVDALIEMAGYPLGIYLGHRYFGSRNYTFGDAIMLYEGRGLGWIYGMLFSEVADINFESSLGLTLRTVGSIGGAVLMDKYILPDDYDFGESVLMAVGTASGMAFSIGTSVLTDINNGNVISALVMIGGGAGFYLTRSILDISKDGTYSSGQSRKSVEVVPAVSVIPVRDRDNRISFQSMIQAEIRF